VPDKDPKKNGCPPDRDGDKIPDDEDACPDVPGEPSKDPRLNGCPQKGKVVISKSEIFILDQVEFDTDKATIKKVSDTILDNVASVLTEHLELLKLEVQGHTDNQGTAAHNLVLSDARAHAVLEALVKRKIDRKRLVAHGYGQEKPIAPNDTPEGRQKNRRVQFIIVEKK
jgi:outer membrane protein OmpA-like peptidoglycan-associated protein